MRGRTVGFGAAPSGPPHWRPGTPLGRSWGLYGAVNHAAAFRFLPEGPRLRLVREVLRPCGAWWLKSRVHGLVPVLAGQRIIRAEADGGGVKLLTADKRGCERTVEADHVLAATGCRPRLEALGFLSPELRAGLVRTGGFPRLAKDFGSSVPGLYFTGLPAAATSGPVLRFVCGTRFASPRLAVAVSQYVGRLSR
ncbi:hypothetical protein [Streptomyces sp. MK37H]|uniref:hypothetical protein n=1 Tax=Streptomyces sp. MK37H TaxID=2699117 RepID=UPI0027E49EC9|nr:hypothetical protein [Streptomyces sp. MK37H]